ncbi:unnamed protein product [Arabis nemorensis]|uniref:Uncharacterized protein n=1 Tax=Arabis nemorensis TaxID=586526 RepID=A0A565CDG6_9BRAS|nr:unnamed protein product [Arabis nemorensis]
MGDSETINVIIHYGGSMRKEGDDYKFEKFEEFLRSELVTTPISLVWYKPRSTEMKDLSYVIDCDDLNEMYKAGKPEDELDLFIEHDFSEHIPARYESAKENRDEDCGYDGGTESDKEDVEYRDDSDDEDDNVAEENVCGEGGETVTREGGETVTREGEGGEIVPGEGGDHVVDDGSDVVADAGNGSSDDMFKALFEEGTKIVPEKKAYVNQEEKTTTEREAEESEEEFGI